MKRKIQGLHEKGILGSVRYKLMLHKAFFGKGQALLSEFKVQYLILGAVVLDGTTTGILGIILFIAVSYAVGRLWFSRYKGVSLTEVEAEVGNQFNKFQQEMRAVLKKEDE